MAIFVEVDDASIHVHKHANNGANNKLVGSGLLVDFSVFLSGALSVEVPSPLLLGENVSSIKVEAPHVMLPRKVLIHQKVGAAYPDAYFRILKRSFAQLINPVLEVVLRILVLYIDCASWQILLRLLDRGDIRGHIRNGRPRDHSALQVAYRFDPLSLAIDRDIDNIVLIVELKVK